MNSAEAKQLLEDPKFQAFARGEELEWLDIRDKWGHAPEISANNFIQNPNRIRVKPKPVERWFLVPNEGKPRFGWDSKDEAERAMRDAGLVNFRSALLREAQ